MTVETRSEPNAPEPAIPGTTATTPARSRLRWATVGGIAAIAILGGGITAAASSGAPAGGVAVAAATGTTAAPSSGPSPTVTLPPGSTGGAAPAVPPTGTAAPAVPPAPKAHQPHLDGTVTSVDGTTVLIKDRDGFTRTVVTSSSTTYRDGLKAALAVGVKIHAEGTVASNGTSLAATVIGVDRGPAGGSGGRGPAGTPGGPGGKHAGPPNGAPMPPVPGGTAAPTPPAGTSAAPSTSAPATTK